MAHVNRVLQIQMLHQGRQIIGIGIQIVAVPRLTRSPVAAPVMRDTTIPARRQEEHLILESVGAERPAVAEYDGLPASPIVVIDASSVFGCDACHDSPAKETRYFPASALSCWTSGISLASGESGSVLIYAQIS